MESLLKSARDLGYIFQSDVECSYCGGSCPTDEEYVCDGYAGDVDGLDSDEVTFVGTETYSGRGMYGEVTCSICCKDWAVFSAVAAHANKESVGEYEGDFVNDLLCLRSDSMGRDIVIY